jgi:hypothetical protein
MWGDTLVSNTSNCVWDGVQLGDGCESTAVDKTSNVDRVRFILWTCTPEVARKALEDFGLALLCARSQIQAEDEAIRIFLRDFSSAEYDKKKKPCVHFLSEVPAMLEALESAQASISSLAACGEDGHWHSPFVAKSKDDCEPPSSTHFHKRRKVLGTATVKAACGYNRVKFRFLDFPCTFLHFFAFQHLTASIDAPYGKQSQKLSMSLRILFRKFLVTSFCSRIRLFTFESLSMLIIEAK